MRRLRDEERGISAATVAVTLVALFGAAMLTVDAGALWTTRRTIITGTDAGALSAARMFATGVASPCDSGSVASAHADATNVLLSNHPSAIHNPVDTPNGFEVTTAQPCGSFTGIGAGKVRFDARLASNNTFGSMFGINNTRAFSSSTAAWGYITAVGRGLRPMAVCDQVNQTFPDPMTPAPSAPDYPHYKLWKLFKDGTIDQTTYDSYFGTDAGHYPSVSTGFANGDSPKNPNKNRAYKTPGSGHSTIHRIKMPDPTCGVSPGNRIWVDFFSVNGTTGTSELRNQLLYGYSGTVSLTPHDCNPSNDTPAPDNCGAAPGDRATLENALGTIACDRNTPALSCPYQFPILVVRSITDNGSGAQYQQSAFLFVVLRGFGDLQADAVEMDFEFIDVQTSGNISPTAPNSDTVPLIGVQLCGADNAIDRCGF